ncbi:hypothetical protein ID866_11059 [Astraeus odoratus]|nr:hypothetical protein ID866_11059 [Astraeus odoratus]
MDYALKRLETFKYVPMGYFTSKGLHEVVRMVCQPDESKTLAITQASEGNITFQAENSLTTSKNVKLDHQLAYGEYMFAKNHFFVAIENTRWGNKVVDTFNWFFHNLDGHLLCKEGPKGECVLLLYNIEQGGESRIWAEQPKDRACKVRLLQGLPRGNRGMQMWVVSLPSYQKTDGSDWIETNPDIAKVSMQTNIGKGDVMTWVKDLIPEWGLLVLSDLSY